MGAKDSKQTCITYEEAVKRVNEAEYKRLKEAFKRLSNLNGFISKQSFVKDVLGDGVPVPVAEYIYTACGGTTKGIALKELLCGLVLITRGREEEKIKFLFMLYSNESGTHVVREEFQKHLHVCESGYIPDSIGSLFNERRKDQATYEEFREWLKEYPDATSLSRWLLCEPCTVTISNEMETPTFYQTLAGVTHLEERDIIELEKRYWVLKGESRTGKLDLDTLRPLISPPVPLTVCAGVFAAFDENRDNHIDFKEMACGISAATRGPMAERQKFCFKVFDLDRDGYLSESEIKHMVTVLLHVRNENHTMTPKLGCDASKEEEEVLSELRKRASPKGLTIEEYLIWSMENNLSMDFLCLLFQVCHIVLGLRPTSSQEEGEIVRGWLEREERRGYSVGQFWYLIAMDWWVSWLEYVGYPRNLGSMSGSEVSLNNIISSDYNPTGSLKRVAQRLTGNKRTIVENCLALENSPVVVTGITSLEPSEPPGLSLSVTPSPSQSPRPIRRYPVKPGPIDNSGLVAPPMFKVNSLTGEGGKLKKNFGIRSRDFELVPDSLWKALSQWYGGSPALPRQVILPKGGSQVELELYPITVKLLRHQSQPARLPQQPNTWSGMVGGYGAAALSTTGYAYVSNLPTAPKRYLAYLATFSRMATVNQVYDFLCERLHFRADDMRLWLYRDENNMLLMEEEEATLEDLGVCDEDQLLIEIRNKDQTWPEEIGSLSMSPNDKAKQPVATEKGATGLNNLGNTCFMNSALQCVSNTRILTRYFLNNFHLYELNRTNTLGMRGNMAKRYGDLIHEIWSGSAKTVAPLKLRWTIGKYAPRFNGSQQHDAQELLAFLLDGLHEDLNRVHDKPYVELNDSDGRCDVNVAQEAWENHILRNKSIIVDLFHGQLKSKVRCKECGHESVRFDPFNYLSLPLPMESYIHMQVTVIRLDGSIPTKYGLRLNQDDKYAALKQQLASLCNIQPFFIKLAELSNSQIKNVPNDDHKIKAPPSGQIGILYAYELPPCQGGSVFGDEERLSINSLKSQREAQTFQAIQRSTQPTVTPAVPHKVYQHAVFHSEDHNNVSSPTDSEVCLTTADGLVVEVAETIPDSGNCSASSCSLADSIDTNSCQQPSYITSYHRKMTQQDNYFVSSQKSKPSLFGLPVIVPCCDNTTHQDLYQAVWLQVARLVSPLPPSETAPPNHAMDCDDSLGYEFPFVLKAVNKDGFLCAWCPWYRFCRGCRIQCCDTEFNFSSNYLAIDWDPTALHLRYQTAQEKVVEEHNSVQTVRQLQLEPINLDYCLEAFTKEEHLGEEEKYYCSKCKEHQLASKKLEIWRLPPILIVHLKRFQYVNGKWVKSQKVVKFPFENFEPTTYLASIPRETVIRHKASLDQKSSDDKSKATTSESSVESEMNPLQDFHQHLLSEEADPFDLRYNLYAITSHSGILGGGHYVAYAQNPNGKWYCYNDSSCKEVVDLDTSSAYMLFYERKGICESRYMPNITGRQTPDTAELDEDFENDFKKSCLLM
ncbi:ubiquitin carboxyl-terminal hydrolase 32-like [Macrosteles quadrilineatus]|uniref:ubiquitin carboxyl-terminal hydrolase 32-like n=1 Tax=Macrosteles quadrilineatus TaxID=74068 RepID=UPI0023E2EDDF|nr:ubiquitin carboxyl-terminal hydrolase 32-like [Macrosteles quadrilineatus]